MVFFLKKYVTSFKVVEKSKSTYFRLARKKYNAYELQINDQSCKELDQDKYINYFTKLQHILFNIDIFQKSTFQRMDISINDNIYDIRKNYFIYSFFSPNTFKISFSINPDPRYSVYIDIVDNKLKNGLYLYSIKDITNDTYNYDPVAYVIFNEA